jgi:KEOPS complex subunit Cgi121
MKIFPLRCRKPIGIEAVDKYQEVQLLDPSYIAGEEHLSFAISQAEKAFERNENISNNIFIEILLRASAQRQIKRALDIFGIKKTEKVIAISENLPKQLMDEYQCQIDPRIIELDGKKYRKLKKLFQINEEEIKAIGLAKEKILVEIIKERVALMCAY